MKEERERRARGVAEIIVGLGKIRIERHAKQAVLTFERHVETSRLGQLPGGPIEHEELAGPLHEDDATSRQHFEVQRCGEAVDEDCTSKRGESSCC